MFLALISGNVNDSCFLTLLCQKSKCVPILFSPFHPPPFLIWRIFGIRGENWGPPAALSFPRPPRQSRRRMADDVGRERRGGLFEDGPCCRLLKGMQHKKCKCVSEKETQWYISQVRTSALHTYFYIKNYVCSYIMYLYYVHKFITACAWCFWMLQQLIPYLNTGMWWVVFLEKESVPRFVDWYLHIMTGLNSSN